MKLFSSKFREELPVLLDDLEQYIMKTYGEHYANQDELQVIDEWVADGGADITFKHTSLKYLRRYGKKDGNNPKDLLKTLHYTLLLYYHDHKREY